MRIRFLAFTALSGLALLPVGARAEMNLSLGGYFSGYGVWSDNDLTDKRAFDLRRDTEVHMCLAKPRSTTASRSVSTPSNLWAAQR
jgi:hypothetical protein